MEMKKAHEVMESLMRCGFSMTTRKFFETTVEKILKKYQIKTKLSEEEYRRLLNLILEQCAIHDLQDMGMYYMDQDDWKDK